MTLIREITSIGSLCRAISGARNSLLVPSPDIVAIGLPACLGAAQLKPGYKEVGYWDCLRRSLRLRLFLRRTIIPTPMQNMNW